MDNLPIPPKNLLTHDILADFLSHLTPQEKITLLKKFLEQEKQVIHKEYECSEMEQIKKTNRKLQRELLWFSSQIQLCCASCQEKFQKREKNFWSEPGKKIRDFSLYKRRTNGQAKYWYASRHFKGKTVQLYIGKDLEEAQIKIEQWYLCHDPSLKTS